MTKTTRLYSVYTAAGSLVGQVRAPSASDAVDYALYLWPTIKSTSAGVSATTRDWKAEAAAVASVIGDRPQMTTDRYTVTPTRCTSYRGQNRPVASARTLEEARAIVAAVGFGVVLDKETGEWLDAATLYGATYRGRDVVVTVPPSECPCGCGEYDGDCATTKEVA